MRRCADAQQLDRLVAAHAWTDAVLALIAIELPHWQLRRVAFDDGVWPCALSRQRDLPDFLDDAVETSHPDMAIAMLQAFRLAVDQIRLVQLPALGDLSAVADEHEPMCCDNYR